LTTATRTLHPARAEARGTGTMFRGPLAGQRPRVLVGLAADPWLLLAVAALVAVGIVIGVLVANVVMEERFGDSFQFVRKHCAAIVLGLVAGVAASRVPSHVYQRFAYPLLIGSLVALVLVLVPGIGREVNGARRWIVLGVVSLQPSEVAKFALVLYLAASIVRKGDKIRTFSLGIVPHALVAGTTGAGKSELLRTGTAALVSSLLVLMLFAGGVRPAHLLLPALAVAPLGAYVLIAESYRLKRLLAFMSPGADLLGVNFQLNQSLLAFGSGGLTGVGLGEGRQKMFYLPAAHTDFIFSVVGEELGLLGALVVLALFAVVAVRGFRIALRHGDRFASLLAFGVTLSLILQAAVNVGVVMGLLPTKGLTLPFVSYGGSAIIASLAQAGVLVALARETG